VTAFFVQTIKKFQRFNGNVNQAPLTSSPGYASDVPRWFNAETSRKKYELQCQ